jgi:hypothetical protein
MSSRFRFAIAEVELVNAGVVRPRASQDPQQTIERQRRSRDERKVLDAEGVRVFGDALSDRLRRRDRPRASMGKFLDVVSGVPEASRTSGAHGYVARWRHHRRESRGDRPWGQ